MNDTYSQELHAEQAVLGSLLLDNNTWDEIGDYLQSEDYRSSIHRDIHCAIRDLILANKKADIICVSQFLKAKSGNDFFIQLCDIANSQFSPQNIINYADIVKQKSIDRKMIASAQEIIKSVHEQKENRLDFAQSIFNQLADHVSGNIISVSEIINQVLDVIDERQSNPREVVGLPTGFRKLDMLLRGLHQNDLIILAGRPSMGKTLLAMNIAEHVAVIEKKCVAIFSLEMSKEQLLERSLASVARVSSDQIKTGSLAPDDFQKIASAIPLYHDSKLFINDKALLSVSEIRSKCRRIKREHCLSMVVIDYISLMAGEGENETIKMGNISRGLKLLARDLCVPVIAISQLNRGVEQRINKRPCMSDLRQSGSIEQDADVILFIYRDEVYNDNAHNKGLAEIIIAKHRNGSLGTVTLDFNSRYCRFDNCERIMPIPSPRTEKWRGKSFNYGDRP